jgi:molybdopterin converting factor subunit 1
MSDPSSTAGTIRVLAFAGARELVGSAEARLSLAHPCGVDQLWRLLLDAWPGLAPFQASIRLAVNGAYASGDTVVHEGDEVALIPPVAGG